MARDRLKKDTMSFNSKQLALRPEELAALTQFSISNELLPPSPSKRPPSLKLSGVTFTTPMTAGRRSYAHTRPPLSIFVYVQLHV